MCGIAGILFRSDSPSELHAEAAEPEAFRAKLGLMAELLAHRGPDDRGFHVCGNLGLAQTRLSIIGLADGHQPMRSADGNLTLVANGEVYNYPELNQQLRTHGCRFQTGSDSETILHNYAVYGAVGTQRLRGMFAFALHDAEADKLLLVRDRLGIKPLFYLALPDRIAFASEIKALLPLLPRRPEPDPAALREFLENQFSSGERTLFDGIKRVLPGEMLVIDHRLRIARRRWWSAAGVESRTLDAEVALEQLGDLLNEVMREHMRADVPFGLFLSGGLDSAVLASLLKSCGTDGIRSYSVGYAGTRMPHELDAAARIARWFGFEHQPLALELPRVFGRIPHSIWAADELMRDYAQLPTSILAEQAGESLKVVFSGEGGDEDFAGYRRYRPAPLERLPKALLRPGSGGFRTRGQWSAHWRRRLFGTRLRALPGRARQPFVDAWRETPSGWSDLNRRQYTDLVTAMPDNLLVKTDRMLMAFGLEGRVPFLDHRLVEFGLSLPDALKLQGRTGKRLLRQWAEPRLPPGHLQRPKTGFHVPVGDWLRGERALRIGELLRANPGVREWFRVRALPSLAASCAAGRGGERELFGLLQFAIWHRLFIDAPGSRPEPDEEPMEWLR